MRQPKRRPTKAPRRNPRPTLWDYAQPVIDAAAEAARRFLTPMVYHCAPCQIEATGPPPPPNFEYHCAICRTRMQPGPLPAPRPAARPPAIDVTFEDVTRPRIELPRKKGQKQPMEFPAKE